MRIVLVRHGQTPSNVLHALDTTVPGPGLTDLGRRQAAAVPAALAGVGVEAVWASTMARTQETAAPLARDVGVDVRVLDGLQEVDAGDLEMRSDEDAVRAYMGPIMDWARGDLEARIPGARRGADVLAGYDAAIARVAASGAGVAAVFSHGAVIRLWVAARVAGVSAQRAEAGWLENTGAITVEASSAPARGRAWTLVDWHEAPLGGPGLVGAGDEAGPGDEGPTGEPVPGEDPRPSRG